MKALTLSSSVGIGADNTPDDVLNVQKALNQISDKIGLTAPLAEDGIIRSDLGPSPTCQAIAAMQKTILGFHHPDSRIDANGKSHRSLNKALGAGQSTLSSLFLPAIEPIKGLTDDDYHDAADALGCEVAAIKAVSDVESAGSGFFESGLPCILFEAHQFSKYSQHQFDDSHPNISSPKWDRSLYVGGEKEYDRLKQAMDLDRTAALKSASFGRYQIMGFNHKAAGYDDVESFVRDMFFAERHHLMAFVHFIKSNAKLHQAIQALDWPTFARHYNGPGYAENRYDERLESAYQTHSA
ncbi:N-acetylmuramidase family protein [Vibrio neptunius]|uniref:N-acetylmuramidase family protein n=1 Tax=Vibrio neptunius TaxID=170651 RepID=UPI001C5C8606|nr:N-acetylmuramidase family protein [Vibrio neptunius]QXX08194.1 N-acetylmuramidase family protein [Vibrio neptunius]